MLKWCDLLSTRCISSMRSSDLLHLVSTVCGSILFNLLVEALCYLRGGVSSVPSGSVRGTISDGHHSSFVIFNSGAGPDYFLRFLSRIFSIRVRDMFAIVFVLVPFVTFVYYFNNIYSLCIIIEDVLAIYMRT